MIPTELQARWAQEVARLEIIFLADHGGGYPDSLSGGQLTPGMRLSVLRALGLRVRERFEMPDQNDSLVLWVRLTNDVAVCLQDGFVCRRDKRNGERHGRKQI